MKKIRFVALVLCLCMLAGILVACKPQQTQQVTVTIVVDGEHTREKYDAGTEFSPERPHKNGYMFEGFVDEQGNNVTFPLELTRDITLTARFRYDDTAEAVAEALTAYIGSPKFTQSVADAKTAAAWLPLAYLRYVEGDFYTNTNAALFKKYINMIDELTTDGELRDGNWVGSAAMQQGWYGILDYLYTYSIAANAYKQYLQAKNLQDTTVDIYNEAIAHYLEYLCSWLSHSSDTFDVAGKQVMQINLAAEWKNVWQNYTADVRYEKLPSSTLEALLSCIARATGTDEGHAEFLAVYKKGEEQMPAIQQEKERIEPLLNDLAERWRNNSTTNEFAGYADYFKLVTQTKQHLNELIEQLQSYCTKNNIDKNSIAAFLPITQVAFGMSATSYIAIIKANLALNADISYVDNALLSYYEKDENGEFTHTGGTPNWVGPTGRAVAASLYRQNDAYDVRFEKYRQGYFPFTDGWNQTLDQMITLDTLGKYYNHDLNTGANVTPQWALLTGYMHGIDMENYTVAQPVEGEPTTYNIITLWRNNLIDEDGRCVIDNNLDMAVAIAYLAHLNGIEAPSPLGAYNVAQKVLSL